MGEYWELTITLANKENQKIINEYLFKQKNEQLTMRQIRYSRNILQSFFQEIEKPFFEITIQDVEGWLIENKKSSNKDTVIKHLTAFRSFFKFCVKNGLIENQPIPYLQKGNGDKYWELKVTLPNRDNHKLVSEYLSMLKNEQRPKGRIIYTRKTLQGFFREIEQPISTVTTEDVEKWLTKKGKVLAKSTITSYLSTFRTFFSFCLEKGQIEKQPIPNMWQTPNERYWELKISLSNAENQIVVSEYLLMLKNMQRSKGSIEYKRNTLQSIFQDIEVSFTVLNMQEVEEWVRKKENVCSRKTIYKYLSILRSFFSYCLEKGLIDKQPIPYMQIKKEDKYWELKATLPNKENQRIVNQYLYMLKNEQWTRNTIIAYRVLLQSFFRDIDLPFSALEPNYTQRWLANRKKDCKINTTKGYLVCLRSFFNYCLENRLIKKHPIPYKWEIGKWENYWKVKIQFPNSENQKVINDYLMSLKIANYSRGSVIGYRGFLQKFFKDRKETFSSLTSNQIQQWFIQHEKGFKEITHKSHLTILSAFYNFCRDENYVEISPIKSRMFPRPPKAIPKYLDKEEVAILRRKSEELWIRDQSILEFLLSSGCRIDELHGLDRSKVDLENRTAMVLGKGKKYRQVHFTEKCSILLERYLEKRTDANAALFVSSKKKANRLSIGHIGFILRQLGKEAALSRSLHPHRLRHTFATDLLSKGADLLFIADELGHKDINTTKIYANLPKQELISLYRKYMG